MPILIDLISIVITDEDNEALLKGPMEMELKNALESIPKNPSQ